MVIKKYQADTEQAAIMLAKEDLGNNAIVMNIKSIQPKGLFRIFMKRKVEVTAAVDDNIASVPVTKETVQRHEEKESEKKEDAKLSLTPNSRTLDALEQAMRSGELDGKKKEEVMPDSLKDLIDERIKNMSIDKEKKEEAEKTEVKNDSDGIRVTAYKDLIFDQLVDAEVDPKYAHELIDEIDELITPDVSIDRLLAIVYQKIILKLGQPKLIDLEQDGKLHCSFFVGPTGVGKTTTIAKIVSDLKLNHKKKVALITADTYRIAAVEQLTTYAAILDIPLRVVYSPEEMKEAIDSYKDYDHVLVDTAGRSHLNEEQQQDLKCLLDSVEDKDVYLTLSITTKYQDLKELVEAYSDITEYNMIFTKLDETNGIGNIYNMRRVTGASLSYITYGQNVPDDISKLDTQYIAKKLLGGKANGPGRKS